VAAGEGEAIGVGEATASTVPGDGEGTGVGEGDEAGSGLWAKREPRLKSVVTRMVNCFFTERENYRSKLPYCNRKKRKP
jgi:hypothetical protein